MLQTPAASISWKRSLLAKIETARQGAVNGTVDMFDTLSQFIHRLTDDESPDNQKYWTGMVDRMVAGEFQSFGHFAAALPKFLVQPNDRLRTAAARYNEAKRPPAAQQVPRPDITSIVTRQRHGRPPSTSAELRLAAMGVHSDTDMSWSIRDAR